MASRKNDLLVLMCCPRKHKDPMYIVTHFYLTPCCLHQVCFKSHPVTAQPVLQIFYSYNQKLVSV